MDKFNDSMKKQIDALMRVISVTQSYQEDHVPFEIEESWTKKTNLTQFFERCFNFIDEAKRQGGGVLVYCFLGRSRSVTIVVAYLMMKKGDMSLSQALEHVKSQRPLASPNSGFIIQLQDFEKSLKV